MERTIEQTTREEVASVRAEAAPEAMRIPQTSPVTDLVRVEGGG